MRELLNAVYHFQSLGVVHQDIFERNIIIPATRPTGCVFIDFGCATAIEEFTTSACTQDDNSFIRAICNMIGGYRGCNMLLEQLAEEKKSDDSYLKFLQQSRFDEPPSFWEPFSLDEWQTADWCDDVHRKSQEDAREQEATIAGLSI